MTEEDLKELYAYLNTTLIIVERLALIVTDLTKRLEDLEGKEENP